MVVSTSEGLLLTLEPDGSLAPYADLSAIATGYNEIVVDGRGNAYVNGGGFNLMAGEEFKPGIVALATAGGEVRQVADGIAFGNGMAVTPDNSTLIVAESYGRRLTAFDIDPAGDLSNRRVWADLGDGTPDGICIDVEGAVWYADVPNQRCVRVREGGEVLQTVAAGPGRLRLHARRAGPEHAVHRQQRVARDLRRRRRRPRQSGAGPAGSGARCRLAVAVDQREEAAPRAARVSCGAAGLRG